MEKEKKLIEGAIFLSQEPVSEEELSEKLGIEKEKVSLVISQLLLDYSDRGIVLKKVAGGYRFFTAPELKEELSKFVEERPVRLSRPLLEVLAIVAYNQPITRKRIAQIRGQNPDGALKSLLEKGLIEVVGRESSPGRPKLYGTTKAFLEHFGLASLQDLPPIELTEVEGEGEG
ncbi:SMC-Scp complex subunit ScpB [Thermovibrio sp.]